MKLQNSKNTPRNFGKYPLLEIINFLNINQQIEMINYNQKLRKSILSYSKLLFYYLKLWKQIKTEIYNTELAFQSDEYVIECNKKNPSFSILEDILLNNDFEEIN